MQLGPPAINALARRLFGVDADQVNGIAPRIHALAVEARSAVAAIARGQADLAVILGAAQQLRDEGDLNDIGRRNLNVAESCSSLRRLIFAVLAFNLPPNP